MADRVKIEGRLRSILNGRQNRKPVSKSATLGAAAALALATMPLAMLQADEDDDVAEAPQQDVDPTSDFQEPALAEEVSTVPVSDLVQPGAPKPASSYQFTNAKRGDVFRFLLEDSGLSYDLPDSVANDDSLITFDLSGNPLDVLKHLVKRNGYQLAKNGESWTIEPSTREVPERMYLQATLAYEDAGEAERKGRIDQAIRRYEESASHLQESLRYHPAWRREHLTKKLDNTKEQLTRLRSKVQRYNYTTPTMHISLKRADATKVAHLLMNEPFTKKIDPRGMVFADARTNSIIISGSGEFIQACQQLVSEQEEAVGSLPSPSFTDPTIKNPSRPRNAGSLLEEPRDLPEDDIFADSAHDLPPLDDARVPQSFSEEPSLFGQPQRFRIVPTAPVDEVDDLFLGQPEPQTLPQSTPQIAGIGCALAAKNTDGFIVQDVLSGSPAAVSGIKPQDKIIAVAAKIDGPLVDVRKLTLSDVVNMCRGPKGSRLRVLIIPHSAEKGVRKEIVVNRDILSVSTHRPEFNIKTTLSVEPEPVTPPIISPFGDGESELSASPIPTPSVPGGR